MEHQSQYIHPHIKRSTFGSRFFKADVLFEDHLLVWLLSGETKIVHGDKTHVFGAGDTLLFPRHLLATVLNYPKNGLAHQSVVMHLTTEKLKDYYHKKQPAADSLMGFEPSFISFKKHPLLQSCLASVAPYFDLQEELPDAIASVKIEEAIHVVRMLEPGIDNLLANFAEPGKIGLSDFMERNYMFNMPLEKFGYLTGRSLTTFKRDFKRAFATTPQKWLTRKRLDLAHYQIREKRRKPSEVYLETGFENLSHFSFAFKKQFGYAPTEATV
ncbi:AraC family transcriptional regulator [Mucilaginibacter pedocola]|uniref:AraC family transcriptional regulator n=1 Tax=Mucilaginibacter pedocola TaxID=1792845 RepID=A0A1S9P6E7_9SPHI|nr:AraC family transcriptional regulator [Mucilaginibacter pedocola]OOQ56515.1 AraC family transcriptional regulator [Mucilaginibacter pedocola]